MLRTNELVAHASAAARRAGDYIRKNVAVSSAEQIGNDVKSTLDTGANSLIEECLSATGLPVISEETFKPGVLPGRYWLVDPLDGTANLVAGFGPYTVSIALIEDGDPTLGFVLDAPNDRLYWTGNNGVYADDDLLTISPKPASSGILYTGIPLRGSPPWEALDMSTFRKVRMIGCASMSILNVAIGRGEVYFEDGIFFWDVAGAVAIAAKARCTVEASEPDSSMRMRVRISREGRQ